MCVQKNNKIITLFEEMNIICMNLKQVQSQRLVQKRPAFKQLHWVVQPCLDLLPHLTSSLHALAASDRVIQVGWRELFFFLHPQFSGERTFYMQLRLVIQIPHW